MAQTPEEAKSAMADSGKVRVVKGYLDRIRAAGAREFAAWQIRAACIELHNVSVEDIDQMLRRLQIQRYPIRAGTGRERGPWRLL